MELRLQGMLALRSRHIKCVATSLEKGGRGAQESSTESHFLTFTNAVEAVDHVALGGRVKVHGLGQLVDELPEEVRFGG